VFLRKLLPAARAVSAKVCFYWKRCRIFVSRCAASAAFSVGAATAAVAENLAPAVVSNVSLYIETM